MWKWVCPKNPNNIYESHSFEWLDGELSLHESGWKFGKMDVPPCTEEHEYWDDGLRCNYPGCNIKYVPASDGDYFVV